MKMKKIGPGEHGPKIVLCRSVSVNDSKLIEKKLTNELEKKKNPLNIA